MTKRDLRVGMLAITENGKARLVLLTKNDGLILVSEDNKCLKVDKMNDDLTGGRYGANRDVVKVYDIMEDTDSELFGTDGRDLLFDRDNGEVDIFADDDDFFEDEEEEDYDNDCGNRNCCGECEDCDANTTNFTKADVKPGMLAVTRDGQNRLAIPTDDMGLVLATADSKFVRMDKLNDDLTIADYRRDGKNVDKVYGLAKGLTTDFYSTEGREVVFDRDAQ